MKKLRRFLTVLLFINFSWGMATGMEPLNFWLVMANGTAVIGLAVDEIEEKRLRKKSRMPDNRNELQGNIQFAQ